MTIKASPTAKNDNAPILDLRPTGNPAPLYRALARIIVRHELNFASAIPPATDCRDASVA
jgi:hypothetical protein